MQIKLNNYFMKTKNVLIAAVTAVITSAGSYLGYSANKNEGLSDIQLANIEALTDNEVTVVSCIKEKGSVCVIIANGVVIKEYKNKTRDRR